MTTFTPYISFPGNAEDMLTFYHSIFGGELTIQKYDDMDTSGFPFAPPVGCSLWPARRQVRHDVAELSVETQ